MKKFTKINNLKNMNSELNSEANNNNSDVEVIRDKDSDNKANSKKLKMTKKRFTKDFNKKSKKHKRNFKDSKKHKEDKDETQIIEKENINADSYQLTDLDYKLLDIGTHNDKINLQSLLCLKEPTGYNFKKLISYAEKNRVAIKLRIIRYLYSILRDTVSRINQKDLVFIKRLVFQFVADNINRDYISDEIFKVVVKFIEKNIWFEDFFKLIVKMVKGKIREITELIERCIEKSSEEKFTIILDLFKDSFFVKDSISNRLAIVRILHNFEKDPQLTNAICEFYREIFNVANISEFSSVEKETLLYLVSIVLRKNTENEECSPAIRHIFFSHLLHSTHINLERTFINVITDGFEVFSKKELILMIHKYFSEISYNLLKLSKVVKLFYDKYPEEKNTLLKWLVIASRRCPRMTYSMMSILPSDCTMLYLLRNHWHHTVRKLAISKIDYIPYTLVDPSDIILFEIE